jgi:hypothetical protein
MIDDRTAHRLLEYIAYQVFREMGNGKTLTEIDDRLSGDHLKKKDRVALFEYMAERWSPERGWGEKADAIVAHLRSLKHRNRKRSPQTTAADDPIARTVIPFRPEDQPT